MISPSVDSINVILEAEKPSKKQDQCPWQWSTPYKYFIPFSGSSVHLAPVSPTPCLDTRVHDCCHPLSPPSVMDSDFDFRRITKTIETLRCTNFYYECLSWRQATKLLCRTSNGTFLIRDSSDPHHLFSISVQTPRGPTSVRVHYVHSQFRLDSESHLAEMMPLFECVIKLIKYYMEISEHPKSKSCVWVDSVSGKRDLPIQLKKPLYKSVSSLQHLCRVQLNKQLSSTSCSRVGALDSIHLPQTLKLYLEEYPHPL